jgi:hypothetical protein
MDETTQSVLSPAHLALLAEARPGIERLAARSRDAMPDAVFLVADVDSPLGKVILDLGVPRHPQKRAVVMPLTRADAIRAAGPLMGPGLTSKLDAHEGVVVLVMAGGSAELVALGPEPGGAA